MLGHCYSSKVDYWQISEGFTALDFAKYISIWLLKNYYLYFNHSKNTPYLRSYKKPFYSIVYNNTNENSCIDLFIFPEILT